MRWKRNLLKYILGTWVHPCPGMEIYFLWSEKVYDKINIPRPVYDGILGTMGNVNGFAILHSAGNCSEN